MAQSGDRAPSASLSLLDATMVGMGAMIGAGIFVLTGLAADIAGPAAIFVFALNGIVTAFTGISYAELASAIPKSGGGYAFVRETFSDSVSFLMGWMLAFAYIIAGALYALGFSSNFVEFVHVYVPGFPSGHLWHILYAAGAIGLFGGLNALSTAASGGAETTITIVKIIILLVVFVAIGTLGAERLGAAGETAIVEAASDFMPEIPALQTGAALIMFGAVFSTLSALNAVILASSRVVFAMGRADQLPKRLGQISAQFGTPLLAVVICGAIMLGSTLFIPIEQVGRVSSFFFLISFVVVNLSVIQLRQKRPDLERPFEMPLYPAIPILGVVLNLVLAYYLLRGNPTTIAVGGGWLALGGLAYLLLQRYQRTTEDSTAANDDTSDNASEKQPETA